MISFDSKTDCYGKWRSGELVLIDKNGKEIEYDGERSVTVDGDEVIFLFTASGDYNYDEDEGVAYSIGNYGYKVTSIQGVRPVTPTPTPAPNPAPAPAPSNPSAGDNNAAAGNSAAANNNAAAPAATAVPANGTQSTVGGLVYTVTVSDAKNGEVAFSGVANKKAKNVNIPATVVIDGVTFQVTSIAAKALKGMKKLKTVTVGSNIVTIGAKAFAGNKKLKKVIVKSAKIKTVAKNAFAGTKKVTVKVPKKQKKAYKKKFKKAKVK